jgi:hypothetical protein
VTHSNDHFQVDVLDLGDQVVQLGLAFGLQHRLVEVEECVSSVGHLLSGNGGELELRLGSAVQEQQGLQQVLRQAAAAGAAPERRRSLELP